MVLAYSSIIVLQQVNYKLGIKVTIQPNSVTSKAVTALDNCFLFIVGGLFFVLTIYVRTMLLEDCGYSASVHRLFDYLKLKVASVKQPSHPTSFAVNKYHECEQGLEPFAEN